MKKEKLVVVDKDDRILGIETRETCHKGEGILHRAVTIFIFNDKGEVLITKRSKQKKLWPEFWETFCSTHVYEGESYKQAAERRLSQEIGISSKLKYLLKFHYKSKYKNIGSENEICALFVGKYNGEISPNPNEVSDYKWISIYELKKDIEKNPAKFAPWLKEVIMSYENLLKNWEKIADKRDINKIINIAKEVGYYIDRYIHGYLEDWKSLNEKFGEVCGYTIINRISEMGKPKLRSTFARLMYQTLTKTKEWGKIIPIAAAVEIWAIATYTIDDILDKQPIRDHVLTAWKKYGIEKGIIAGIVQREMAEKMLFDLDIEKEKLAEIIKTFIEMQFYVYYGQYLNELEISNEKDYIKRVKYLSYDAAPLAKMVAIAAGASLQEVELAYKIGENLGIASMIRNDLMDIIPEEIVEEKTKMLSRVSLEDLRKGVLTYPLLFFANTSEENKKFIYSLKGKREINIEQKRLLIKKLFESGAVDATLDLITKYKDKAIELIKQLKPSKFRDQLIIFASLMENTRIYAQEVRKSYKF